MIFAGSHSPVRTHAEFPEDRIAGNEESAEKQQLVSELFQLLLEYHGVDGDEDLPHFGPLGNPLAKSILILFCTAQSNA